MIEFLNNYGMSILSIVCSVAGIVVYLLKKNKVILKDTPFEKLMVKLPSIISKAEELGKDGKTKKSFVLSVSYALLADLTGLDVEEIADKYCDRISEAIESILETPQKKGSISI